MDTKILSGENEPTTNGITADLDSRWKILFLMLVLFTCHTLEAQNLSFKKFKKTHKEAVSLPYTQDQFWWFENEGNWGLYSQTRETVLVPAQYELILPSLEKDFFYITKGDYVGLYAVRGGELIAPNRLKHLRFHKNELGERMVSDQKEILRKWFEDPLPHIKPLYFSLSQSADSTWQAMEIELVLWTSPYSNQHEDRIEYYSKGNWIHHHSHLEVEYVDVENSEPWHLLTKAIEHSGIISNDRIYLIPPRYVSIETVGTHFYTWKAGPISEEPSEYSDFTKQGGIYSREFKEIIPPTDDYIYHVPPDGFYLRNGEDRLTLLDKNGNVVTDITDFRQEVDRIRLLNDKYYITNIPWDEEQVEMGIPDQYIYTLAGDLADTFTFSFLYIPDEGTIASIEKLRPGVYFELRYGLFDLEKGQMVTASDFDDVVT